MGTDYIAHTIIGIPFDPDDFIERRVIKKVLCDHSEAAGFAFCPVCGRTKEDRTEETIREHPRPQFAALEPFCNMPEEDCEEGWLSNFSYEAQWDDKTIAGLYVRQAGPEQRVLGFHVNKTESSRSSYGDLVYAKAWSDVADKVDELVKQLKVLGLENRPLQVITWLEIS